MYIPGLVCPVSFLSVVFQDIKSILFFYCNDWLIWDKTWIKQLKNVHPWPGLPSVLPLCGLLRYQIHSFFYCNDMTDMRQNMNKSNWKMYIPGLVCPVSFLSVVFQDIKSILFSTVMIDWYETKHEKKQLKMYIPGLVCPVSFLSVVFQDIKSILFFYCKDWLIWDKTWIKATWKCTSLAWSPQCPSFLSVVFQDIKPILFSTVRTDWYEIKHE